MRIVYWNIRAGGGRRVEAIAAQLEAWQPDVVGLSEYRGTPASLWLAERLAEQGLACQLSAVDPRQPAVNAVMLAARRPLRRVGLRHRPDEPRRWLFARLANGPAVGVIHAPNYVTGRKQACFSSVLRFARLWRGGPAIFGGDTNTGIPPVDGNPDVFHDFEADWIPALARAGWLDAWRHREGPRPAYTWYSPNAGNGYRLDQAFVHRSWAGRLRDARYVWGTTGGAGEPRHAVSDHAALVVDLDLDAGSEPAD